MNSAINYLTMIFDVMWFEMRRSMTKGRMMIWCVLVAFPVILFAVLGQTVSSARIEEWGITLYMLVPEIVVLLGLLLWATPAISTEIEGQTWIYLAMRRSGRSIVLLGKYATAVAWALSASIIAITLCMFVVPDIGGFRLWSVLTLLCVLSCIAHAAIFVMLGVFVHRRTMVTAAFYTLAIEYGLSFVPAVANKLTVNYRLRGLLANWMDWEEVRSAAESFFGTESVSSHLGGIAAITVVTLTLAMVRLQLAQYPTQQDG